jgi:hypothetical protein
MDLYNFRDILLSRDYFVRYAQKCIGKLRCVALKEEMKMNETYT